MTAHEAHPRGVRNNNPFNIKKSKQEWLGKVEHGTDNVFEQFENEFAGIRAGIKLLYKYYNIKKLDTITKILSVFAPTSENETKSYIQTVCKLTGFTENEVINLNKHHVLFKLAVAIITVENKKNWYPDYLISGAIYLIYNERNNVCLI